MKIKLNGTFYNIDICILPVLLLNGTLFISKHKHFFPFLEGPLDILFKPSLTFLSWACMCSYFSYTILIYHDKTYKEEQGVLCLFIYWFLLCFSCEVLYTELAWCGTIIGILSPIYIYRSKPPQKISLKKYFNSLRQHPDLPKILDFWQIDFKNRKKIIKNYIFGEVPLLSVISTYAILSTLLQPLERALIVFCLVQGIMLGWWLPFLTYYGVIIVLTILSNFPPLTIHLKKVYGPDCLYKLRWYKFSPIIKESGQRAAGIIVALTLSKVGFYQLIELDQLIGIVDSQKEVEHLFRKNQLYKSHYFMLKEKYPDLDLGEVPKISQKEMTHAENPENFRPFQVIKGLFPDSAGPIFDRVWDVIQARAWKK
jgi:hypothetical protein